MRIAAFREGQRPSYGRGVAERLGVMTQLKAAE